VIHNDHFRLLSGCVYEIARVVRSPGKQRDAHGFKEVRTHKENINLRRLAWFIGEVNILRHFRVTEQRKRRIPDRSDPRNGAKTPLQFGEETRQPLAFVAIQLGLHAEECEVVRIKADVHGCEVDEGARQQRGAHQDENRKGHLGDDEHVAQPESPANQGGPRRADGAFLQCRSHVDSGATQRRRKAEENSREYGDGHREPEDSQVGMNVDLQRRIPVRGKKGGQGTRPQVGKNNTEAR